MTVNDTSPAHRFSVAPMMDWTDRHCRAFHRLLTKHALLYTEMITAPAVIHGDRERLIGFSPEEQPLALQLGGSDPEELAEASRIAEGFGYSEINLNCGCPSDRVQSGRFGACLMAEPELVANCIEAMQRAVAVPVTVKCRIGIDDQDEDADLDRFIDMVADTGCTTFIVHARKAWLKGLSPKENRDIPPLNYDRVFRLKQRRSDLTIILNGGLASLNEAHSYLDRLDGVMFGREAYHNPWVLAEVDEMFFGEKPQDISREDVMRGVRDYAHELVARGEKVSRVLRHVLGLYQGQPRARAWRRHLSETMHKPGAGPEIIDAAMEIMKGTNTQRPAA